MAETGNTKATVSKFERMSVEELEEAIRIYFEADDLDENMENLLLASEVLDRKKEAMGDLVDTDAQWARFQRDYLPLLNDEDIEEGEAEGADIDKTIKMTGKVHDPCSSGKKRTAKRVFHAVAVAALIALVLGLTACATIPQIRESIVNFLRSFGNHSVVSVDTDDAEMNLITEAETYELAGYTFCVPKEYELDYIVEDESRCACDYIYGGSSIFIYIGSSDHSPVQLDTEDTEAKTITINGKEGLIIEKESWKYVTFGDPESDRIVFISGENVEEETLLNIANTFIPLND